MEGRGLQRQRQAGSATGTRQRQAAADRLSAPPRTGSGNQPGQAAGRLMLNKSDCALSHRMKSMKTMRYLLLHFQPPQDEHYDLVLIDGRRVRGGVVEKPNLAGSQTACQVQVKTNHARRRK